MFDLQRKSLCSLPTRCLKTVTDVGFIGRALDPHGAGAAFPITVIGLRAAFEVAAIQRQHNGAIVRVSYIEKPLFCIYNKIVALDVVEAAGVERFFTG